MLVVLVSWHTPAILSPGETARASPVLNPAAVAGRLSLGPAPAASASAQPDSWAVGVHAVNGTPNPTSAQGIEMTAFLPTVPPGLVSTAGPYYMLVMSAVFPNGRFLQIDLRASPPGTDGCILFACYQSVYDIAKFHGSVNAFTIGPETSGQTYTIALWRDGGSARWRYGIAQGTPPNVTVERNDFLSNLDPNFSDADAYPSILVDQADEWFGTASAIQEFAALESYDWSSSDWSRIGTLTFGPAVSFLPGTGSSAWPVMRPSRAALACTTGVTCRDPDGRQYLGLIGCCNGTPGFATVDGLFQGQASTNAFFAGGGPIPGAAPGDILWADLPTIVTVAFTPDAIRSGNGSILSYGVENPNGFSLWLGFRRAIRSDPAGVPLADPSSDLGPLKLAAGLTTETQALTTSAGLAQSFYDVRVDAWSGIPGAAPASTLTGTGWVARALAIDDDPPTTTASLTGTHGQGGWYLSTVTVAFEVTDAVSGLRSTWYRLDGANGTAFVRYTVPVAVTTDGPHTLVFFSVDRAGNAGSPVATPFDIDASPPLLEILSPADGAHLPNGTFRVVWTAQDTGSGIDHYTLRVGGDPPINMSLALSRDLAGLPNGTYVIRVTASDWAGNVATKGITIQVGMIPLNVGLLVLLAIVLPTATVLAYVALRRRNKPPEGPKAEQLPREDGEKKT